MSEFKTWRSLPIWKDIRKELKSINPDFNDISCRIGGPNGFCKVANITMIIDNNDTLNKAKDVMNKYKEYFVLAEEDYSTIRPHIAVMYHYIGNEKPVGCKRRK